MTEHSGGGDINKSLALMWDFDEKPTRGPKPALTLDKIVASAIEIADTEGLDVLSMRRVADALGVGTMSLYRYVPGKAELLDLMLDRVNGPPDPTVDRIGTDWRSALEEIGQGLWRLYTEHAWLPFVDQTRPLLGPNALAAFELAMKSIADMGLTDQEKVNAISTVEAFAAAAARPHNSAVTAEKVTGVSNEEFWAAQEPVLSKAMDTGRFPVLAGLAEDAFAASGAELFEFGLQRMLDGLEVIVGRRSAQRAG